VNTLAYFGLNKDTFVLIKLNSITMHRNYIFVLKTNRPELTSKVGYFSKIAEFTVPPKADQSSLKRKSKEFVNLFDSHTSKVVIANQA
jgi:hypothetical protein